ncbi:MAG: hypothetical protein Q9191_001757 [Dirinaria sp. TL-2023a]
MTTMSASVDHEKLAAVAGFKNGHSAASSWNKVKNRIIGGAMAPAVATKLSSDKNHDAESDDSAGLPKAPKKRARKGKSDKGGNEKPSKRSKSTVESVEAPALSPFDSYYLSRSQSLQPSAYVSPYAPINPPSAASEKIEESKET